VDLSQNANVRPSTIPVVEIAVDALVPLNSNVNEMDEKEMKRLAEEINETGMISPIQVIPMADGRFTILGGEHRWRACRMNGFTHVPALVLTQEKWQDQELQEIVAFRLNSLHGKVNPEKFVKMWDKMIQKHGADAMQNVLAVTDDQVFKKLANKIKRDLTTGMPKELKEKISDAEKKSKTIDEFGKMVNKIFKNHTDSIKSNFLLFKHGNSDHLLLSVSEDTFRSVKIVSDFCLASGKSVDEVIGSSLAEVAGNLVENQSESTGDSFIG
jgi:ParB/RepB/Spo0J family partition protein